MYEIGVFFLGMAITIGLALAIVLFLKNSLYSVLSDLCGPARARFWTVFSIIVLLIVPFALALSMHPAAVGWHASFFEITSQIGSSLIGFGVSVVVLGWILTRAIRIQSTMRTGAASERGDRA